MGKCKINQKPNSKRITVKQAINRAGSGIKLAKALGLSTATVYHWVSKVPNRKRRWLPLEYEARYFQVYGE